MAKENKTLTVLWAIIVVLIIAIIGSWLLVEANGYKINWKTRKIEETGMIYLKFEPKIAEVYLNAKIVGKQSPAKLFRLLPGRYDVEIKKDKYQSWKKTFIVESGRVESEENVLLFYNNPVPSQLTNEENSKFEANFPNPADQSLKIVDGEIWWIDDLITRLSQPVKYAAWFPDKMHIIFQINREVHLIELDGSNDQKLFSLNNQETTKIVFNGTKELIYRDGKDLFKLKIK